VSGFDCNGFPASACVLSPLHSPRGFGVAASSSLGIGELVKILLIGASGTLGTFVAKELAPRHEIIAAGKTDGKFQVDTSNEDSVRKLFQAVGKVDAIVVTAGAVHWGPLSDMTADQFKIGLLDKLMGQVNVTRLGQHSLNDGGSITLTSGGLSHDPYPGGAAFTTVNAAVDAFVRGAAVELDHDRRINSVSPAVLKESWDVYGPGVPGTEPMPGARVALAYRKSVEGRQTGQNYRVW
jgi:NAD(P)-dependent dehydrogenase (short-subunit alcohol dehydrogenase family)